MNGTYTFFYLEIVSNNYPLNSESEHLQCNFEVKALHGSKITITPVDVELDGGCSDNKLTILDDSPQTENSSLTYPGLSASCGQSSIPPSTHPLTTDGTVTVKFLRTLNSGPVKFKIIFAATSPEICPNNVAEDMCPDGPCCQGEDCCVYHAGSVPKGENINVMVTMTMCYKCFYFRDHITRLSKQL